MKNMVLFMIVMFSFSKIRAQNYEPGYLLLKIYGDNKAKVIVDETSYSTTDTILALMPGNHSLKIQMNKAKSVDTVVAIKSNDTAKYSYLMELSKEYLQYKKDLENYKTVRNKRAFVSPIWMGLTAGTGLLINNIFAKKEFDAALYAQDQYLRTGLQSKMDNAKSDFEMHKKKHANYKKAEYVMYGISAAIFVNYVRIIIKQKKTPIPKYKENTLSSLNFNLYSDPSSKAILYGLSIKF